MWVWICLKGLWRAFLDFMMRQHWNEKTEQVEYDIFFQYRSHEHILNIEQYILSIREILGTNLKAAL